MEVGRSETVDIGGQKIFLNVYVPPPRLIIVGAVHIAQSLAPMATLLEFDVTVVDPRGALATANRFPGVKVIQDWADEAFQEMGLDVSTAVVTLTHDPKLDDPALESALQVGRLLYRRARQPKHPCQAQGAAGRGRHHRRDVRPHPRPGRPQHRRQVAGRDRRLDPRPDHRGACPPSRSIVGAEGRGRVRFGETPIDEATGAILAHSRRSDGINFSKGRRLSAEDVDKLKAAGVASIVAARLDPDDIHEDQAAAAIAKALAGVGHRHHRALHRPLQSLRARGRPRRRRSRAGRCAERAATSR